MRRMRWLEAVLGFRVRDSYPHAVLASRRSRRRFILACPRPRVSPAPGRRRTSPRSRSSGLLDPRRRRVGHRGAQPARRIDARSRHAGGDAARFPDVARHQACGCRGPAGRRPAQGGRRQAGSGRGSGCGTGIGVRSRSDPRRACMRPRPSGRRFTSLQARAAPHGSTTAPPPTSAA
jgi:hypothetical protein